MLGNCIFSHFKICLVNPSPSRIVCIIKVMFIALGGSALQTIFKIPVFHISGVTSDSIVNQLFHQRTNYFSLNFALCFFVVINLRSFSSSAYW